MIYPFMPNSVNKLFASMNIEKESTKWKDCGELIIKSGHKINKPEILFEKIENKTISEQKEKLK